jgi:hypothetical protein
VMRFVFRESSRRAATIACATVFMLCGWAGWQPVSAATGPFAALSGRWSGTGIIRQQGGKTERIRCNANYRPLGSTQHEVDIQLDCASDSYKFDLVGQFHANESNQISGRWTERSRSIGGTGIGFARGTLIQIHVESSAFAATMHMATRGRRQSVTIDSQGGGAISSVSITLHRR